LTSVAFAVEISLAVARQDTSSVQINNEQDLYRALTNREMLDRILEQGLDYILSNKETFDDTFRFECSQKNNRDKTADYFMNTKNNLKLEELKI
jgi:hypothetical protein